jgi:glyoxylase-like metal-dependent hydrolase (beta-lactamase superfamily II)
LRFLSLLRFKERKTKEMKFYAMACGRLRVRKNVFIPDANKNLFIEIPLPIFLITHPQGNVLFDTGPHPDVFKDAFARWGGLAKAFQPVGNESDGVLSQLAKIGVRSDSIRYVVNSHLHFDHAGGNEFFSYATFLVSGKELAFAKNPDNEGKGYFQADWDHPLDYQEVDGQFDIFGDGRLVIAPMPGHTLGHQILVVRLNEQETFILSGDSVPFKEHYYDFIVARNNLDNDQALKSVKNLHALVEAEKAFLIHGHDPDPWEEIKKAPDYYG